jgi:hypothetical protein
VFRCRPTLQAISCRLSVAEFWCHSPGQFVWDLWCTISRLNIFISGVFSFCVIIVPLSIIHVTSMGHCGPKSPVSRVYEPCLLTFGRTPWTEYGPFIKPVPTQLFQFLGNMTVQCARKTFFHELRWFIGCLLGGYVWLNGN